LKQKKTLSQWLTNRFLLIIRSEENFAEKRTFSFTYAKLIVFSLLFFSLVFIFSFYLITTLLAKWFDPRQLQIESDKKIIQLSARVDSLSIEQKRKEEYIADFRRMLGGQDRLEKKDNTSKETGKSPFPIDYVTPQDSLLRASVEKEYGGYISPEIGYELANIIFFPPVEGVVTKKFNILTGNLGIDVAVVKEEYVKAITDGTVIFAGYTEDKGNVIILQHKNQLVSVYKHNTDLLKKEGDKVKAGEVLGLLSDKTTKGKFPHLHFELWLNNNAVNPENYIVF